jgi:pilus assembly protein FimV
MHRKPTLPLALLAALICGDAFALGLGNIQVFSALNQPFNAEIELVDIRPDELDAIKASLAGEKDFMKVGSERHYFLTGLKFRPQVSRNGQPVLSITTTEPIREPYLDFLLEVNWPAGRMLKEYTVLLDLPVNRRGLPTQPRFDRARRDAPRSPAFEATSPSMAAPKMTVATAEAPSRAVPDVKPIQRQLREIEERSASNRLETAELFERLKKLEDEVSDAQMELKQADDELAALQPSGAQGTETAARPGDSEAGSEATPESEAR